MAGPRHLINTTDANSRMIHGIRSTGRTMLTAAVLLSQITGAGGVIMAGQTVSERKGKETALTATELETLQTTIKGQIELARKFAKQKALGMPTGTMTVERINIMLITSIMKLNDGVRAYNPRTDPSGRHMDYVEAPKPNVLLDSAALNALEIQVALATSAPNRASLGTEIATTMPGQKSTITSTPAPTKSDTMPATTATVITQPKARTLDTIPTPIVQQLTAEERSRYQTILENLDLILRTEKLLTRTRSEAGKLLGEMKPCMEYAMTQEAANRNRAKLESLATTYTQSRTLANALKVAQETALTKAATDAGIQQKDLTKNPFQKHLLEMQGLLQKIPQSDQRRQLADNIINQLPNVWLLDEETPATSAGSIGTGPRWEMYEMLRGAMTTLTKGGASEEKVAKASYDGAAALFRQEQASLMQRVTTTLEIAEAGIAAIRAGGAPTQAEILAQEQKDGVRTAPNLRLRGTLLQVDKDKVERERYYHTSPRGLHNGREDLEAAMVNRADQLRKLAASGGLSSRQVSDLEAAVAAESYAATSLAALWGYCTSHGIEKKADESKEAWKHYSIAAATLADATVNPYQYYSDDMKSLLLEQYRNATGDRKSSDDKIIAALMRSPQWKYDDVLYGVYQHAYRLAPAPADAAAQATVTAIGNLRGARIFYDDWNRQYVEKANRNADQRIEDARFVLTDAAGAVKASGAKDSDVLLASAAKWLAVEVPKENDAKERMADYIYNMAIDMLAIREAEVWLADANAAGRNVNRTDLGNASRIVDEAKREFQWYFSVTQVNDAYYPNLPRNVANEAVKLIAPAALAVTEKHAGYAALAEAERRKLEEIALGTDAKDAALRKARLTDRPMALESAQGTEAAHVRMLFSLMRATPDFGIAAIPASDGAALAAYSMVSPNLSRRQVPVESGRGRLTTERADLHFDYSNIPHEFNAYPYGAVWGEINYRQTGLQGDENAPVLLRKLNLKPLTGLTDTITRRYGNSEATPVFQLNAANEAFIRLLDARIAELDARLNAMVKYEDKMVPVKLFGRSDDPRAYFVIGAQEALAEAKKLRPVYAANSARNLFNGSMPQTPKQAIMMTEIAIAMLSDANLNFRPGKALEATLTPFVNRTAVRPINVPAYGNVSHAFFNADVTVASGEAKQRRGETPAEYAARTGAELNLTYDWMFFAEVRQDYFLVVNPNLYQKGHENEPECVARIMRNMATKLPDGRTAYPVIAARPPGKAAGETTLSRTLDYELEVNQDGSYNILLYVTEKRGADGRPIFVPASAEVSDEARQRLFREGGAVIAQPMVGDVQASVIVRQK